MYRPGLLLLWTFTAASLADVQVNVIWAHEDGTHMNFTAVEFAKLAEEHRDGKHVTNQTITKRNAVSDYKYLWYRGTVFYEIDSRTADFRLIQILTNAFTFFHRYTCIRWRRKIPGDGVKDYVVFSMPYGGTRLCNSAVGKQSGRQFINLDTECVKSLAEVLHQMTHALGFYHVHSRYDRDTYISVHPENASPENRKFFNMEAPGVADAMGFPYDHKSLLHFDAFKYSTGFDPTIKSKIPGVQLGNKIALTVQDISMINTLYTECKNSCRFKNGLCEQSCYDEAPGKVTCSCVQGYQINNDGKTCYDTDECALHNGGCDQTCITQGSWYRCECDKGFSLDKNGYSCRANNLCDDGTLKCEQGCVFNKCTCKEGYSLNKDGLHCDDVNECSLYNGGCAGSCKNTYGSYQCGCAEGQYLSNDGKSCTDIVCPVQSQIADGSLTCTNKDPVQETECHFTCNPGFKLEGENMIVCRAGQWSGRAPICKATDRCALDNGGCEQQCWANSWSDVRCSCRSGYKLAADGIRCKDIEPPTIISCPKDIYAVTVPEKSWASVTWDLPRFFDNEMAKITSGPVMQDRIGGVYDIGAHSVDYVITDLEGNQAFCSFKIKVTDKEAPDMFNCPQNQTYEVSASQRFIEVDWEDPSFWDNSESVKVTTDLADDRRIQPREQEIHYIASDQSGNSVVCTIKINIKVKQESCDVFPETPADGSIQCDQFLFGSQCRLECDNGYDLRQDGAPDYYTCQKNVWKPAPQKYTCPGSQTPLRSPQLYYEIRYKYDCEFSDLSKLPTYAVRTAMKSKSLLCPASKGQCTMEATYNCTGEDVVVKVSTTDPVDPKVNVARYLSQVGTNVFKQQSGFFFYMPIAGTILSPEANSVGLKAVPKIDFACKDGDTKDRLRLKCYSSRATVDSVIG